MLNKLNWRCVLYILTAILGIIWVVLGFGTYGFWSAEEGPGAGFFPAIVGCVLVFFSIVEFIKSIGSDAVKFDKEALYLVASVAGILILNFFIGLFPALVIYYVAWLKFVEKYPWKKVILITIFYGGIMYGVFSLWLQVPFPTGILLSWL